MSLRVLPAVMAGDDLRSLDFGMPAVLDRWPAAIRAADGEADNTISIYDAIGADPWTGGGVTAKRIAAALRAIGSREVIVNINSPGGDLFEGIAIYNLLREHKAKVTVKVVSLAASAASIIAMAGDRIEIAKAGFLMIHNAWVLAMGNRHDLRDVADMLEPFDAAIASVYEDRTGLDGKTIVKMMDKETWIAGEKAVEQGFADALLPADQLREDAAAAAALAPAIAARQIDAALAKQGVPRSRRRELIRDFRTGTPSAAGRGMPRAADPALAAAAQRAILALTT